LFDDKIGNFIGQQKSADFDPVAGSEFRYENIGQVWSHGGEFQLRWRPVSRLDIHANFARVFTTADTSRQNYTEDIPLSTPRNVWGLLASYRFLDGWETSLAVSRTDAVKWLTEGDDTLRYTRVDARIAKRWKWQGREVETALVGQNLGEDYQEFRDTNRFSRRLYGSVAFAW
jgi:iron complex outermembrane receptor protein